MAALSSKVLWCGAPLPVTALCVVAFAEQGNLSRIEQSRAWALLGQPVPRIAQRADSQRKATAADATVQLVTEASQTIDPIVQFRTPFCGENSPIVGRRSAFFGE
jgi:hypothetical protein